MKRILIALASIAALILPMLAFAPAASAATGIVTNGMAWTAIPNAGPTLPGQNAKFCTLGVVGTDSSGNKIAISARHCLELDGTNANVGDPVFRYLPTGAGNQIGTVSHYSPDWVGGSDKFGVDWVVIKLNADSDLRSNGPGVRIDGIGTAPVPGQVLCKDGVTTGVKCGAVYGVTPTRIASFALASGGDSGGPAYVDTNYGKIVGMTRGLFEFINFSQVLSDIAAQSNPVGKGFVVTNN